MGVAAWENRTAAAKSVLPLAALGGVTAAYHSYIQVAGGGACGIDGGCAAVQYQVAGLSIPNLALTAFVLVALGSLAAWVADRDVSQ